MDECQLYLIHWGRVYRSVGEMPASERPEDAILDNDARFDSWLSTYIRKLSKRPGQDSDDRYNQAPKFGQNSI